MTEKENSEFPATHLLLKMQEVTGSATRARRARIWRVRTQGRQASFLCSGGISLRLQQRLGPHSDLIYIQSEQLLLISSSVMWELTDSERNSSPLKLGLTCRFTHCLGSSWKPSCPSFPWRRPQSTSTSPWPLMLEHEPHSAYTILSQDMHQCPAHYDRQGPRPVDDLSSAKAPKEMETRCMVSRQHHGRTYNCLPMSS